MEASTDTVVTNDMKTQTYECISLGSSVNCQGSIKCFDLCTRKVVTRRTVKEVPMPDRTKKLAEKWGSKSNEKAYNC